MAEVVSEGPDHLPTPGRIMSRGEMKDLLAKFGMMVGLDETADAPGIATNPSR